MDIAAQSLIDRLAADLRKAWRAFGGREDLAVVYADDCAFAEALRETYPKEHPPGMPVMRVVPTQALADAIATYPTLQAVAQEVRTPPPRGTLRFVIWRNGEVVATALSANDPETN